MIINNAKMMETVKMNNGIFLISQEDTSFIH
jgi:hypothetical protein